MSVGFPKIPTMAKTINISYKGESAVFGYKPIDRGVLYGKRRRVPFDGEGNECAKASLLEDGSLLIKSGMTAQGYFTPDKVWVAQGDLEAITGYPAYVVHWTDFSATRKSPLDREVRLAPNEKEALKIAEAMIADNIKKGWSEVAK